MNRVGTGFNMLLSILIGIGGIFLIAMYTMVNGTYTITQTVVNDQCRYTLPASEVFDSFSSVVLTNTAIPNIKKTNILGNVESISITNYGAEVTIHYVGFVIETKVGSSYMSRVPYTEDNLKSEYVLATNAVSDLGLVQLKIKATQDSLNTINDNL